MISDLECARLCARTYRPEQEGWLRWIDLGGTVAAGMLQDETSTIIAFRGSIDAEDWLHDLSWIPKPVPVLGLVHRGFYQDLDKFHALVAPQLKGEIILTGHSLGAAHACLLAGLLAATATPAAQLCLFGCPRPGWKKLRDLVTSYPTVITSYRNRDDPVPMVPEFVGLFVPIIEPTAIKSKTNPPKFFGAHAIELYVEALTP